MTPPKPKRGRPRAVEPGSRVTTWIRLSDHDRLITLARSQAVSVSSVLRQIVKARLSN